MVVIYAVKSGQLSAEELSEGYYQSSSEGTVCSEKMQMKFKKNPAVQTHNEFVECAFHLLYLCNN